MTIFSDILSAQTTIRERDALEAVNFCRDHGDILAKKTEVSDPDLCRIIHCNSLLQSVLEHFGVKWESPALAERMAHFFRTCGRGILCALVSPLTLFTSCYAAYALHRDLYRMRSVIRIQDENKTVRAFLRNADGAKIVEKITERSGNPCEITEGETNGLSSCNYATLFHAVSLPRGVLDSALDESFALMAHECGHAEQRKFLLAYLGITVLSILCLPLAAVLFTVSPIIAICLIVPAGLVLATRPIVVAAYEVDASHRAIANLIALDPCGMREREKSDEDVRAQVQKMVRILQLASTTYIASALISVAGMFARRHDRVESYRPNLAIQNG
jgi:Zn-dependent membrane protease YugP